MARPKMQITNDQGEIIKAIKKGNRAYVWDKVKFIGFNDVNDVDTRYLIFNKAFGSFDPYKNNNFILFYKTYLKYERNNREDDSYFVTNNRTVINTLKSNFISPSEENQELIKELEQWAKQ